MDLPRHCLRDLAHRFLRPACVVPAHTPCAATNDLTVGQIVVGGAALVTVKRAALVAVPPAVVTVIGPVVAPPGTVAVIWIAVLTVKVAFTPLIVPPSRR